MATAGSNVAVAMAATTAAANAVINRTLSIEFIIRPKEVCNLMLILKFLYDDIINRYIFISII